MKKLSLILVILCCGLFTSQLWAEPKWENPSLATIGTDITLTKSDVINHARPAPNLYPYLTIPGGPRRILEDLIQTRLLILEGLRLGMTRPAQENGGDTAFTIAVRLRLAPRCAPPGEEATKAFYDAHPEKFSTPPFLRLNRFGLRFTPENREALTSRLQTLATRLAQGETTFAAIAPVSDDEFGKLRAGDLGFVAQDDPSNPIMAGLAKANNSQIVGPLEQGEMLYLYQITARREAMLEPYEGIRMAVAEKQQAACYSQRVETMFEALKQRWPVKILVDNVDSAFEAK